MKSAFLNLNLRDFAKGLLMAVITAVIAYLSDVIQTGNWEAIDWKFVASTAGIAAVGYIVKNLFTNSEGQVLKAEEKSLYK